MAHLDTTAPGSSTGSASRPVCATCSVRASQLNGCAYCVDCTQAPPSRRSRQRIHAVAVWAESPFFTETERAAFAFAESVTRRSTARADGGLRRRGRHWSPDEVGALLALIVAINGWNMLAVATRA